MYLVFSLAGFVAILVAIYFLRPSNTTLSRIKDFYDLTIQPSQEQKVKISSLYLYPVRGIRGITVDYLTLTESGALNDRLWVMIDKKKNK
jgi:hypothetical protein